MPLNISKIILPSIVGVSVYIVMNKLFPEKLEIREILEKDTLEDSKGGDGTARTRLIILMKHIVEKVLKDRALKVAVISVFVTAGAQHFQAEVESLLVDEVFNHISVKDVDGDLTVVCDIIEKHEGRCYCVYWLFRRSKVTRLPSFKGYKMWY